MIQHAISSVVLTSILFIPKVTLAQSEQENPHVRNLRDKGATIICDDSAGNTKRRVAAILSVVNSIDVSDVESVISGRTARLQIAHLTHDDLNTSCAVVNKVPDN